MKSLHKLTFSGALCGLLATAAMARAQTGESPFLQRALERNAIVSLLPVERLAGGGVLVDGDVAEWAAPEAWPRDATFLFQGLSRHDTTPYAWTIPGAQAATTADESRFDAAMMRLAFDNEALYFAARVADDAVLSALPEAAPETGDAVELRLDLRPPKGAGGFRLSLGDAHFDQWGGFLPRDTFGLIIGAPEAGRGAVRQASSPVSLPIGGAQVAARRVAGGYEIEARIPFSSLQVDGGRLTLARLKQSIGVQFHVHDRDRMPPPNTPVNAMPPAPAYTWTRDERPDAADRFRGLAWGATWLSQIVEDAPANAAASQLLDVQLSPLQLDGTRLFWRGAALWSGTPPQNAATDATDASLKFDPVAETSAFDALSEILPSEKRELASPLIVASREAKAPSWQPGEMHSQHYPSLGASVVWRDLDARALPGGRYLVRAKSGERTAERAYLLSWQGLNEFAPGSMVETSTPDQARQWLQKAYWQTNVPSIVSPADGTPAEKTRIVTVVPYFGGDVSQRIRLSELGASPQAPFWAVQVELRRAGAQSEAAPQDAALWSQSAPLRAGGVLLEMPTAALAPGSYALSAKLMELEPATTGPNPKPRKPRWTFDLAKAATTFQVAPPRPTVWPASVTDAPDVLHHWTSTGSPARDHFPGLSGVDASARGIRDLQWFDGRLYTGDGDVAHNRAPSFIFSYAPGETAWRRDLSAKEEGLPLLRTGEIGKETVLLMPGVDPADPLGETKELGNLYLRRPGIEAAPDFGWIKRRTIPQSGWTPDVATWRGRLYAATTPGNGKNRLQVSDDGGMTWKVAEAVQGREMPDDFSLNEMAPLSSALLIVGFQAESGVLLWDGAGWTRRNFDLLPGEGVSGLGLERLTPCALPDAPDGLLYTSRWGKIKPLFFLPSPDAAGAQVVAPFEKAQVRDIVSRENTAYVLTGKLREGVQDEQMPPLYDGEVFSSRDLKTWTRHAAFTASALPNALEVGKGRFYVGLGARRDDERDAAAGEVLRLEP